jgi:RNA polymerase-interacting CarD/CdnL/TRCF family regulator
MFSKVKRILASEIMYAKQMAEDEAVRFLDGVLAEICTRPGYAQQGTVI